MDREAKLPVPTANPRVINRLINPDNTSSSSSSFYSTSPPDFLRQVQAACKRHRPLGTKQPISIKAKRMVIPQEEISSSAHLMEETKRSQEVVSSIQAHTAKDAIAQTKTAVSLTGETHEDVSITPPYNLGAMTKSIGQSYINPLRDEPKLTSSCRDINLMPLHIGSQHNDQQKKVQFSIRSDKTSEGALDQMATGLENLSSHMGSLALTEMEWSAGNQGELSTIINNEPRQQNFQNIESDMNSQRQGGTSLLAKGVPATQDQMHHFKSFLGQPYTQSSVIGPSYATTTSVHSTSAPLCNSGTYCSHTLQDGDFNVNTQPANQGNKVQPLTSSHKDIGRLVLNETAPIPQPDDSTIDTQTEVKEYDIFQEQKGSLPKESKAAEDYSVLDNKSNVGKGYVADISTIQSQEHLPKTSISDVKVKVSKSEKLEKVSSSKGTLTARKKNYDPDLFFKVNGKLYQRLGKIGSGGSSEVHKVISSDCTIYALKKIKLKGRDYATAYGFCQEIVYLHKLVGKDNIIQLIDYEVTDKTLLKEVLNGSMSNKDARVKDDGYIYMVLEYGEIDLAHMLSQKWKEIDGSNTKMDENWLRFFWQQILLAVNTIHEQRIVHSDLKPANFLLVKGSLKLIDFGIAKAIMSDTTNIQRDSQVGTLSYMSPEAFLCNESDENGNTIKCGRPSDIWSLGCILYQMAYGRTPFSDYKTFWAKFKVITDPNHEIMYEPVLNPWLLDLMKKCLAWDRNERWRIPQLLQHPFLIPPIPPQLVLSRDQCSRLLQLIADTCANKEESLMLCSQLQQLCSVPIRPLTSLLIMSRDQCEMTAQMSEIHRQLQKDLASRD